MPLLSSQQAPSSDKPIWYFLLCWTILNALQAYKLEIHADEAYYWMYSRFLDWGYFDHPPMVAIFIRIGDSLMHNELGLRLMTILASTASVYLLWLILKKYAVDALSFILVISGIFIFHIYGFITTPDAPLFFFTVLFYFFYQKYLESNTWLLTLALGVVTACMLYSKYHAVLLIVFTLLSNIKLLKRGSFWGIVILAVALYIPHILWQFNHGFPSVSYHLYDRSESEYDPSNSFLYIPGQLLMAGPVIGWFLFYKAFTIKVKDAFIRCLLVNCIGTFIFFFISTFRGEAQPHWTLIAFASLAMLVLIQFKQRNYAMPKWFYRAAVINLCLILFLRISLMFQLAPIAKIGEIKSFYGYRKWAQAIKQKAGNNFVIMADGFQNPSKYNYYTNCTKGFSYDSRYYRHTQYDIWPIEEAFQHKRAYYLQDLPTGLTTDTIKVKSGKWYAEWIEDTRTYQKVIIDVNSYKVKLSPLQKTILVLKLTNPYPYPINFSNVGNKHEVVLGACFFKGDVMVNGEKADSSFNRISLQPGASLAHKFTLTAPAEKGNYDVLFSIRTTPFAGAKNSRVIHLTVE
ncbi:MAG TPA: glycosyltransferase family 39 protein [Mucilaginibacter sp.]